MVNQITEEKINDIVETIAKEYQPEKIILFGSFAWGQPHQDSDIDLLVIKKSNKTALEMMREVCRITLRSGEALDVLVYTPERLEKRKNMGDPFVLKIINQGKVLYAAS